MSKAIKRERQKQNRELARVERERMMKRQRRMKSLRTLLILLSPLVVIGIVISLFSSGDDKPTYTTATIETSEGNIVVGLETDATPVAAERFISLAKRKFYDGLCIDRLAKDAVIQGGSPACDQQGGEGNPVAGEISRDGYPIGTLAGWKGPNDPPGTFDSQFFIVTGSQGAALPNEYARFGTVLAGLDIAQKIEALPVEPDSDKPAEKITIKRIRVKTTDVKPVVSTSKPTTTTTTATTTAP